MHYNEQVSSVIFNQVIKIYGLLKGIELNSEKSMKSESFHLPITSMSDSYKENQARRGATGDGGGGGKAPPDFFLCLSAQRSVILVDGTVPLPDYVNFATFFRSEFFFGVPPPPFAQRLFQDWRRSIEVFPPP